MAETLHRTACEHKTGDYDCSCHLLARIEELERQLAESERQARIFRAQVEERGRIVEATRLQLETARQDERERCAKVCEERISVGWRGAVAELTSREAKECAKDIRALHDKVTPLYALPDEEVK